MAEIEKLKKQIADAQKKLKKIRRTRKKFIEIFCYKKIRRIYYRRKN